MLDFCQNKDSYLSSVACFIDITEKVEDGRALQPFLYAKN